MSALVAVIVIVAVVLLTITAELRVRELRQQLAIERERTGDLLTRLAVRTPSEYAAVTRPPAKTEDAVPAKRYGIDPTGLVRSEIVDA